ncbi:TolB family protein [Seonamhaeicola aphaedonensis]|uniref:WD40 repeat protein n=1 Tax=Seonamhaeicola aphaedonensis TaxID=1461338 RepID=A0A3D9HA01_9FLAO|nr:PD40 domain-containing protein [Seonamhaeicola aphaedonensis]RED46011.1 WD40 repeat protein [Seonamhaeicola aphaedonensis]
MKRLCPVIFFFGFLSFSQSEEYTVTNIQLNNEFPHFGLMPTSNGEVVLTSFLLDKKGRVQQFQGESTFGVYKGIIDATGDIQNVHPIKIDSKQNKSHITSAAISPDGKRIYITIRYTNKNKPKGDFNINNFHIEVGEYKEDLGWTNFKVLPFCKPKYSYAHPSLSSDGKTLYFTANFRGGKETTKGGSDIFKVSILDNQTYTEPENLGSEVNSYSREMFPVITNDNTLYFASNRPSGYGGYDIYKSVMKETGTFAKAEKLPKPLNSVKDDFSLITFDAEASGFLSSKRPEGKGDDDVYYFTKN